MKDTVLTIGKFDGVHAGHAVLLGQVAALAAERGLQPTVMTFDPHPACVVAPERAPRPLISLEERCAKIRALGIEEVFILPFTHEISRLSPEEFVSRYVRARMQARVVMVGRNFRFGYKQSGDPEVLAQLGARYGFETRLVEAVKLRRLIASASEIRRRIEAGEVSLAARLLGRPYALAGKVVAGFGIGSRQTVPTLNLHTSAEVLPRDGVYITRTHDLETDRCWNSITNIGMRPTFEGTARTIETFLLEPVRGLPLLHSRLETQSRLSNDSETQSRPMHDSENQSSVGRETQSRLSSDPETESRPSQDSETRSRLSNDSETQSSVGRETQSRRDPEKPFSSRDCEEAVVESPRAIRVDLLRRVREERKFASPEALKAQILLDVARARIYFRRVARWVRVALP